MSFRLCADTFLYRNMAAKYPVKQYLGSPAKDKDWRMVVMILLSGNECHAIAGGSCDSAGRCIVQQG